MSHESIPTEVEFIEEDADARHLPAKNRIIADSMAIPSIGDEIEFGDEEGGRSFVVERRVFSFFGGTCLLRVYIRSREHE